MKKPGEILTNRLIGDKKKILGLEDKTRNYHIQIVKRNK